MTPPLPGSVIISKVPFDVVFAVSVADDVGATVVAPDVVESTDVVAAVVVFAALDSPPAPPESPQAPPIASVTPKIQDLVLPPMPYPMGPLYTTARIPTRRAPCRAIGARADRPARPRLTPGDPPGKIAHLREGAMPKKAEKVTLNQDFTFTTDADLNAQIAAFAATHEATHDERLAMDARRSLGPTKVRVTFRIVARKPARGARA